MISIGKCADSGYYTDSVGGGRESYYLDAVTAGEPPGRWSGRLAEQVGLVGEVDADDMRAVFSTFVTPDGTPLGRAPARYRSVEERLAEALVLEPDALPERVAELRAGIEATQRQACLGWDLTASAPKSVTVAHTAVHRAELGAIRSGDPDRALEWGRIRFGIEEAILAANATAIDYASMVTTARAGRHGARGETARWEPAPDLMVASFLQHTSRSIQPQLHVHNVVLNRAGCADGVVRALDGVDLLAQRAAIGAVFDLDLAARLRALGLDVATRPDGMARELVAVEPAVCDLFSERRRVITAALAPLVTASEERLGRPLTDLELARLSREVTLRTRQGKTHDGESVDERHARWQADLRAALGAGLDPIARRVLAQADHARTADGTAERLDTGAAASAGRLLWSPSAVIEEAVAAVAEQRPTWRRADLIGEISRRIPTVDGLAPGDAPALLERLADVALADRNLVAQIAGDGLDARPLPAGIVGASPRPTDARYAAAGTLAAEDALRRAAVTRGGHALDPAAVRGWLDATRPDTGPDQRAAVVGLATTDAAVAVLVGPAGTGKSHTAGALAEAWADLSGGGRVIGLTTSQTAAEVLAADGLNVTANLAAFAAAQRRLDDHRPLPGDEALRVGPLDVLLVDEASMVATADLAAVRDAADAAGARIVLSGDPRQLGAVGAGGVLGLLAGDRAETYTLADVRRFAADWETTASLRLRDGDPAALAEYDRHGRILDHPDLDHAVAAAARAVAADRLDGRTVLAVADTNALAARVSAAVRDRLIGLGLVRPEQGSVELGRDGVTASAGDVVQTRRNDRRLGVLNRGRGTIAAVGDDGSIDVLLPDGRTVTLPPGYVAADVSLGYCATVHGAQGQTVDACHLITEGRTDPAALYVGLSRGRVRNTAHVALAPDPRPGAAQADHAGAQPAPTGRAVLAEALDRPRGDDAATVTAETDAARRSSAETLGATYEDVVRQVCRARMERHLDALAADGVIALEDRARLAADQGSEHLSRLLRAVEQSGHDPQHVLRSVVEGRRGLADAVSVAQVLSSRITGPNALDAPLGVDDIPHGIPTEHAAHLAALRADLDRRRHALGAQTAAQAPAWAVAPWGPPPEDDPVRRLEWEDRAGRVALHREATGWTDPHRPLGPPTGVSATERRAAWWDAQRALGGPDVRDEVAMTDGQLRVRITAWQREQAWAPPHADTAQRAAEQDAETARQDAVHAAAGRDPDAAADRLHKHAKRAGAALALDRTARARAAWAAHTAPTRAAAERAADEARRRGLHLGDEPDRTTAADWLADDRAARAAADTHRTIGEDDVLDPLAAQAHAVFPPGPRTPGHRPAEPVVTGEAGARVELPERPSRVELASAAAAASAAAVLIADRDSHDAHEPAADLPEPVDAWDHARRSAAVDLEADDVGLAETAAP